MRAINDLENYGKITRWVRKHGMKMGTKKRQLQFIWCRPQVFFGGLGSLWHLVGYKDAGREP